jgi:2-methylcitrate dehydratase PrpD
MTGLTLRVAHHIATTPAHAVREAALHASERSLLDALGVMLAATTLGEGCAAFADLAMDAPGPCTVIGRTQAARPLAAVLANGALAHAIDYEDALDGAPVHPNAAIVPVVIALAESDESISGGDLVAALAIGCDLVCRMGLALKRNPDEFGWYPPPILSTFGAAAAAARLLHLTPHQTAHALALALAQATFSAEFKSCPDSTLRAVRDAFPAHAGLLAAQLARNGVNAHETALEGKAGFFNLFARGEWEPSVVEDALGARFHGEDVAFKPWPSCRGTHAFIEAALHIRGQAGMPADIVALETTGASLLTMLTEPAAQKMAPATAIDAKFSLPFCTAAALIDGRVDLATFAADRLRREDVLALARRHSFSINPALTMKDGATGSIALRLADGRTLTHGILQARGAPASPLSDADLTDKFAACAAYARRPLAPGTVTRLAATCLAMRDQPKAGVIFTMLRG